MYLVDEFKLGLSKVSEFIAWVGVPIVLANIWLIGFLASRYTPRAITICSAFLTGSFMLFVIIPSSVNSLRITLFLSGLTLAVCLPSCASMLSILVSGEEQGRVMGNNQSPQVGAEALSGISAGLLASLLIKLPLFVLGSVAILAAFILIIFGRVQRDQ